MSRQFKSGFSFQTFFHAVDTSGDKAISFDEYMVAMQKIPAAFHRIDTFYIHFRLQSPPLKAIMCPGLHAYPSDLPLQQCQPC